MRPPQLVTHSLNFIIVDGAAGGSDGAFDIEEARCVGKKETEWLVGWGGCHHCSGTSKDSSADVSKQDGCQVSFVHYLSNNNRLASTRHALVRGRLRFYYTADSCLFWSLNLLWASSSSFFNSRDFIWIDWSFFSSHGEKWRVFVVRRQWVTDVPQHSLPRRKKRAKENNMPDGFLLPLWQLSSSVSEKEATGE